MKGEVAKVEKYGVTVWSNTMMDELRKEAAGHVEEISWEYD